jgi:hypothetical protein
MSPDVQGTESFTRQDNPVQCIIHSLTLAQIAAIETTPFTLVPAPGANEFTQILSIISVYTPGTVAATPVALKNYHVKYTDGSTTTASPDVLATSMISTSTRIHDWAAAATALPIGVANKSIELSADAGSLTAGNGTINIIVRFVQHATV